MKEGLRKLYLGDFNTLDGVTYDGIIKEFTLYKDGEDKIYRFKVKDLYGEHEQLLEHEVIDTGPSEYILVRMKEAKEYGNKGNSGPE